MQIETDYAKNLERLKKLQGLTISHAVEDEYYVDGELFTESRGELQLVFTNDLILMLTKIS